MINIFVCINIDRGLILLMRLYMNAFFYCNYREKKGKIHIVVNTIQDTCVDLWLAWTCVLSPIDD